MRKFLVRWWFTPNWEDDCWKRAVILWHAFDPSTDHMIEILLIMNRERESERLISHEPHETGTPVYQ
jgi:hypothetical protein